MKTLTEREAKALNDFILDLLEYTSDLEDAVVEIDEAAQRNVIRKQYSKTVESARAKLAGY
jgi:hypothetical protein